MEEAKSQGGEGKLIPKRKKLSVEKGQWGSNHVRGVFWRKKTEKGKGFLSGEKNGVKHALGRGKKNTRGGKKPGKRRKRKAQRVCCSLGKIC